MSKLQSMPIMDRLFIGNSFDAVVGGEVQTFPIGKQDYKDFADHKRVLLTDSGHVPPPPTSTWDIRNTFGHLMLPYPRIWIEWTNTRGDGDSAGMWLAASCKRVDNFLNQAQAHGAPGGVADAFDARAHSWIAQPYMLHGGRVVSLPMLLQVDLDEHGVLHGVRGSNIGPEPKSDDTAAVVDILWDALIAVGWMNCRNVEVRHHDRSGNVGGSRRKRARNQARGLDFHTIHLPGVQYDSDGTVSSEGRELRLHHVRGHFKTFTAEAPLLGQHVGTYWWGWQVRGNKKNGEVISDYKVGAAS